MTSDARSVPDAPARPARQPWVDQVRWIAIVLVVVGHFVGPLRGSSALAKSISDFVYTFHIPALVLLAGWSGRRLTANGHNLTRTFWQLIVPLAVFQAIALILDIVLDGRDVEWTLVHQTFGLWFLVALTGWRLLAPWFHGLSQPVLVATVIALAFGAEETPGDFLSLSRIVVFLPLFLAGPALVDAVARWRQRPWAPAAGVAILVAGAAWVLLRQPDFDRTIFFGRDSYAELEVGTLQGMALRLAALAFSTLLAVGLMLAVPGGLGSDSMLGRWTARAGRHTMYPYLLHLPLLSLLAWSGVVTDHPGDTTALLLVAAGLAFSAVTVTAPFLWAAGPLVEPRAWWDRVRGAAGA